MFYLKVINEKELSNIDEIRENKKVNNLPNDLIHSCIKELNNINIAKYIRTNNFDYLTEKDKRDNNDFDDVDIDKESRKFYGNMDK